MDKPMLIALGPPSGQAKGFDMRQILFLPLAISLAASSAAGSEPMAPVTPGASATKARDISGFILGMPIQDAAAKTKILFAQGELVETVMDGIEYDFGVCPSGKIYRIESRQQLGSFIPDKVFTDGLVSQLEAKYGKAGPGSPDNLGWELIEPVRYSDGEIRNFRTNWLSVMISGGFGTPVEVQMKLLDFRVCWEDKVRANQAPRDDAMDQIVF